MSVKISVVIVATAFALGGCSVSDGGSTAESANPEPAESSGPGTKEFASIIAENRRDIDDWLETWSEYGCSTLGTAGGDLTCQLHLTSGGLIAQTVSTRLNTATKTDAPGYLGQPPDEISIIWQSTEANAVAAADAAEDLPDDCSSDDDCAGKVMRFHSAMSDLQTKFDSWDPYM